MKKMMSKLLMITVLGVNFFHHCAVKAQEERIIYEYKQRETIDLGEMEIKGGVISPLDISINERDRTKFSRKIYDREHFNQEMRFQVLNLR